MIKLYIDDLRKEPQGWVRAKTVTEAIRILATQEVSEVSLDHDISHRISMDSTGRPFPCGETFEAVAWFLACKYKPVLSGIEDILIGRPKITIHTANPIGARKMAAILADAGLESTTILGVPVNGLE